MYNPTYDPVEHLDQLKTKLLRHTLNSHEAIWIPERRLVLLDRSIREDRIKPVLAHECVHVEHNDMGGHHPRNEARADTISALRTIDPAEWRALTRATDDYDRICLDLGITRAQFMAFHTHHQRQATQHLRLEKIGATLYINPKMGSGQWTRKLEVANG